MEALPKPQRCKVRVADTEYENDCAKVQAALATSMHGVELMDDAELVALLEEPECFVELTPLERELVVRLGARMEIMQRMDKQALDLGIALD
ncbi:MAG: hypothetical protein AMXMBFR31_29560 [Candidatus Desulfobacillus denitrificans]